MPRLKYGIPIGLVCACYETQIPEIDRKDGNSQVRDTSCCIQNRTIASETHCEHFLAIYRGLSRVTRKGKKFGLVSVCSHAVGDRPRKTGRVVFHEVGDNKDFRFFFQHTHSSGKTGKDPCYLCGIGCPDSLMKRKQH